MPSESDELIPTRWTLIKRLKNWDDQESWREFFDIYWELIYSLARKHGLSPEDAEDVVQNTVISFCKCLQNGSFNPDPAHGSLKGWLCQQVRWRIADQERKRPPAKPARPPDRDGESGSDTPTTQRIPDKHGDPSELVSEKDWQETLTKAALKEVAGQVSARDLQVFEMIVFHGASPESVAKLHEIERNNVDQIKHRVEKRFKEALAELKEKWGE